MSLHRSRSIRSHGTIAIAATFACTLLASVTPASLARFSDPVRNLHPEEPAAAPDVQSPIHYVLPTSSPADPSAIVPEALLQEFLDRHTAMNYPAAAEAALRLINAVPDRPSGYYNLACSMARMQRTDEALEALQQAVDRGWRDLRHMKMDFDLATLRSDARYQQIVAGLTARIDAERIVASPTRTDPWQDVAADLAREIPPLLKSWLVPGASVALICDGRVVWTSAFGVRDARDATSTVAVDDPFRLRAPLHLLAIAACAELEHEGKIELARLMQTAASQYAMVTVDPAARGTDNDRSTGRPRLTGNSDAAGPNQRRVADMTERPRSYTRVSVYGLLRLAAEVAAGQPFAAYCRAALLEPMNLSQTGFSADERSSRVVLGHSHLGTPLRPSVVADEFETDGSLFITAGDVARMIAQTMGEPLVHEDHGIFLGEIGHDGDDDCRKSHEQSAGEPASRLDHAPIAMTMSNTTPGLGRRISGALDLVTRFDAALGGGLGLAVQRVNGGRHEDADARPNDDDSESILELAESACGIVCLARWNPHTGRGIVILCNSATASPAAQRIAHKALGGSGH